MEAIGGLAVSLALIYGGYRVVATGATPGEFFSFMAAMLLAYEPAKRLARINLDLNAGLAGIGQSSGGYLAQAQAALGLSRDVTRTLQLFTDLSFASRDERHGRSSVGLDAGVVVWPTFNIAVDASFVTSLVGQGPDWGFRSGVSVRFGHH